MGSNPAQGKYSFPQLSSVEFPVTFSQFLLNLDLESICDPPAGDTLLAQGIYYWLYISRMIKIEYPTMMPLARRIQKDTKRLDSDKLIGRMKK